MTKDRPTIDDVAALAGVGRATVSRVLNDRPNVRPQVRERVMRAVAKLDYQVNLQARGLASKSSKMLALVHCTRIDAEPNSYYDSALELGALRAAALAGFELSTLNVVVDDPRRGEKVLELFTSGRCAGVILPPPLSDDAVLARELAERGLPAICVSPGAAVRTILPGVGLDDEAAGNEMGRYAIALGHRRFGYLLGLEGHRSAEDRFVGFMRALHDAGIDAGAVSAVRGDFTVRAGVELSQSLLEADVRPTILACANDDMAVGALFAAHRMGFAIPAQLSIVGFDDTPISAHIWPPLTTVHQPIGRIGFRAVERLIEETSREPKFGAPKFEVIEHRMVLRESAGVPLPS